MYLVISSMVSIVSMVGGGVVKKLKHVLGNILNVSMVGGGG